MDLDSETEEKLRRTMLFSTTNWHLIFGFDVRSFGDQRQYLAIDVEGIGDEDPPLYADNCYLAALAMERRGVGQDLIDAFILSACKKK